MERPTCAFEQLWHRERDLGAAQRQLMQAVYDTRYDTLRKPLGMPRTEPFPRGLPALVPFDDLLWKSVVVVWTFACALQMGRRRCTWWRVWTARCAAR